MTSQTDDKDTVSTKDPDHLRNLMEQEAGNSAHWLKDNRLCVAGNNSKFLVVRTTMMRWSRGFIGEMKILVDDKEIKESSSEKLLGVVLNNELT